MVGSSVAICHSALPQIWRLRTFGSLVERVQKILTEATKIIWQKWEKHLTKITKRNITSVYSSWWSWDETEEKWSAQDYLVTNFAHIFFGTEYWVRIGQKFFFLFCENRLKVFCLILLCNIKSNISIRILKIKTLRVKSDMGINFFFNNGRKN